MAELIEILSDALSQIDTLGTGVSINCKEGTNISLTNTGQHIYITAEFPNTVMTDYYVPYSVVNHIYELGWQDWYNEEFEKADKQYYYDVIIHNEDFLKENHYRIPDYKKPNPNDYINMFTHIWFLDRPDYNRQQSLTHLISATLTLFKVVEQDVSITFP
jgi:hypothetical protein